MLTAHIFCCHGTCISGFGRAQTFSKQLLVMYISLIFFGYDKKQEKCNKDYKMFTCHAALTTCQGR